MEHKILPWQELKKVLTDARSKGNKIVFTNGCFDVLHLGHVTYLREAKRLGDLLVVALNSDSSVTAIKGPQRPIVPEQERAAVVAALEAVDYVTVFQEDTPYKLIELLQPDIIAKGGDWTRETVVGADIVDGVAIIPSVPGVSTTDIISRIEEKLRRER